MIDTSTQVKLKVREIRMREHTVRFRLPFRFGAVTLTEEPQLLVDLEIELEDGTISRGVAAEALSPKWFDKDPDLSDQDNFNQLRTAVDIAAGLYRSAGLETAFGLFLSCYPEQLSRCEGRGLNHLLAGFGQAILDRAVLDALCNALGISFYQAVRNNVPGIRGASIIPELWDFDMTSFLGSLRPSGSIDVRHTIGLLDPITSGDLPAGQRINDGLPETLEEVIRFYGNRYFKIKISGDADSDIRRLERITSVLTSSCPWFRATLDGNEQYRTPERFLEFWSLLKRRKELAPLAASIIFIEQPLHRNCALELDVTAISSEMPVIIDESDADLDAFPRAVESGYRGVSSKQCKGLYKSLINKGRCVKWNRRAGFEKLFISGEDLTTQGGTAIQQDLALASILGITHLERNGHHYVRGMSGESRQVQERCLLKYPGLYVEDKDCVRLDIREGKLDIRSLDCPGFAS